MTDQQAYEMGRRWVAAGFRIVPGTKTLHARTKWSGGIVTGFDYDGSPAISTGLDEPFSPQDLIPDPRDPGNKGHAVAQLRERMKDDTAHLVRNYDDCDWYLRTTHSECFAFGDTEEDCITAALEATKP